jgi:hypothetical protein
LTSGFLRDFFCDFQEILQGISGYIAKKALENHRKKNQEERSNIMKTRPRACLLDNEPI